MLMYQARRAQAAVGALRLATAAAIGERQRLVADLYYRGLSLGEVAEVLDVPRGTAQRYVEDARIVYAWRPTPTMVHLAEGPSGPGYYTVGGVTVWAAGSPQSGPEGSG